MLSWIARNRTVLAFKLRTYTKSIIYTKSITYTESSEIKLLLHLTMCIAQSSGAGEYTDGTSGEG